MGTLAVIWRAAGLLFATEVRSVIEVLPPLSCSPAPTVPTWVRGLFCYRDLLVPLVDVARLLDRPAPPDRMVNRVLVVRCAHSSASAAFTAGLWVESVVELERLDFDAAGNHPGFATDAGRFLGPVAQTRWGQVQLVRPEEIFTAEQVAVLSDRLREAAA